MFRNRPLDEAVTSDETTRSRLIDAWCCVRTILSRARVGIRAAVLLVIVGPLFPALGEGSVQTLSWDTLHAAGALSLGTVLPAEKPAADAKPTDPAPPAGAVLKIEHTAKDPGNYLLATIEKPALKGDRYAIRGHIRYERLVEAGYLELLNYFAAGGPYFTRTLAANGPLAALKDTSPWRPFMLPFHVSDPKAGRPTKLELKLCMAGPGTVWIGPCELVELDASVDGAGLEAPEGVLQSAKADSTSGLARPLPKLAVPPSASTASTDIAQPQVAQAQDSDNHTGPIWWTPRTGALLGAIGGALIGLLGACVGVLAARGKARAGVLGAMYVGLIGGGVCLILGIAAIALRQPYGVYYPLLLIGVILLIVIGGNMPGVRQRYQALEMQRMAARDMG